MASNKGSASRSQEQQQPSMQSPNSRVSAARLRTENLGQLKESSQGSSLSKNHCPSGQAYDTPEGQPSALAEEDREKENALEMSRFSLLQIQLANRIRHISHMASMKTPSIATTIRNMKGIIMSRSGAWLYPCHG